MVCSHNHLVHVHSVATASVFADSFVCVCAQSFGAGGEGAGLWLNDDFEVCVTDECSTFHNQPLFYPSQIEPERVELWELR